MPTDVSDEALERMVREALTGSPTCHWRTALELVKQGRDLTAARCREACEEASNEYQDMRHSAGCDDCSSAILALFPGAKP